MASLTILLKIEYKTATVCYSVIWGSEPPYLADLLRLPLPPSLFAHLLIHSTSRRDEGEGGGGGGRMRGRGGGRGSRDGGKNDWPLKSRQYRIL